MRASSHSAALARLAGTLLVIGAAAPAAAQDYYADIRPLLVRNCLACHSSAGPGWSMQDPETTYALRHAIAAAILERRMPPWLAEPGHQQYVNSRALPADILDLVRRWRDGGFAKDAPRPDPRFAADPRAAHAGFQADVSVDVLPGGSYLPNQTRADDYRCFVADWPGDTTAYVTGFRAVVGNRRVGHHLVVYAIVPGMVDRFRELDAEEEGPGYECFGSAVPDRLARRDVRQAYEARYPDGLREMLRAKFWLAHWAPGMDGHDFPEGTGIRLDPGSGLVVQMHYYAGAAPGERDAGTRMEFRIASDVERPAFHLPQTFDPWLAGQENGSMVIPPGQMATYQYTDNLGDLLGYIARITRVPEERIQGLEIHSANLHMHAIGHSGVISLRDRFGRKETLLSVPRWDLRWQQDFTFAEPKVFGRDELEDTLLSVECTFRNPKPDTVYGGYGSGDEMCFDFAYIAVRTGEPAAATGVTDALTTRPGRAWAARPAGTRQGWCPRRRRVPGHPPHRAAPGRQDDAAPARLPGPLRQVGDFTQFQAFLRALAARSGQLINLSDLARDLGVAVNTIKAWVSVLEASFQVLVLRPYFANVGKRLVKTPKIYFTDVGTLCHLTGLRDPEHAAAGPMGGAILETAVLSEIVRTLTHRGLDPQVYFWRTSTGTEVDFVVEAGGRLIPLEVKLSATPRPPMAASIRTFRDDVGASVAPGYVIHTGDVRLPLARDVLALPFGEL